MTDDNSEIIQPTANMPVQPEHLLPDKTKILLMYALSGRGHLAACQAIEGALRDKGFTGEIKLVDILPFMPRVVADMYSKGYLYVASKMPWLWYALYEIQNNLSEFKPPSKYQNYLWKILLKKLGKYLKEEKPDYIISAYFTASWAAGRYKGTHNPACRVATVVTDYGMHPVWLIPCQDRYFVATDYIKRELTNFDWFTGVKSQNITVAGIPIEKRYALAKDKVELKRKFELDETRFTVLILAGAYGQEHIEAIIKNLISCESQLQLFIVASKTFRLTDKLAETLIANNILYRIYGMIDFMHELTAVADIAITKTGGLSSTECLVSGCPLLIYKPYPGQEEENAAFFMEKGAAWRIYQLESLGLKLDKIALDKQLHQQMVTAAKSVADPLAAEIIANTVLEDIRTKFTDKARDKPSDNI